MNMAQLRPLFRLSQDLQSRISQGYSLSSLLGLLSCWWSWFLAAIECIAAFLFRAIEESLLSSGETKAFFLKPFFRGLTWLSHGHSQKSPFDELKVRLIRAINYICKMPVSAIQCNLTLEVASIIFMGLIHSQGYM